MRRIRHENQAGTFTDAFSKLAGLQDLNKKEFTTKTVWETANLTAKLQTEVALLYDILGEDVPEEYWEQIEEVI